MNNTTEGIRPEPQMLSAVLYGCIMTLGFPLNAAAIWISLRRHSLQSSNMVFLLNMAVSDLILVSSLPLRIYYHATGSWPFHHIACVGVRAFFHANIDSSAMFISLINVDRLLAVVYPLRSRHIRTTRNAAKAAVLVWIFVILMTVFIACGKYLKSPTCYNLETQQQHRLKPSKVFQFILLVLLLIVNVVSAVMVSMTLRKVKDLPNSNKANLLLLFVTSLIVFTVCFVPMKLGFFIRTKQRYLKCFAAANTCLDPVIYYFSLKAFWRKKEDRNQLNTPNV